MCPAKGIKIQLLVITQTCRHAGKGEIMISYYSNAFCPAPNRRNRGLKKTEKHMFILTFTNSTYLTDVQGISTSAVPRKEHRVRDY